MDSTNPGLLDWGALLAHTPAVLVALGADDRITHAAGGGVALLGGAASLVGRAVDEVLPGTGHLLEQVRQTPSKTSRWTQTRVADRAYTAWLAGPHRAVVLATPTRRAADREESQAQRLQSLGRLAGGVAHDFNNVLMAVMGHAQLIERRADDDKIRTAAATIVTAAERAAGLTEQLLGFARQGKLRQEPAVVDDLVAEVGRLLARTLERRIRVVHRKSSVPAVVCGDPGQLQQVILNLALNARDAMPDGGELIFATSIVEAEPTSSEVTTDLLTDTWVKLAVTDTGAGMSEEVRARVFEPYFTTKDVGEGHGLGLSMVYGIVRNHDGWVRVHSRPNEGSTFEVFLPLDREQLLRAPRPSSEPSTGRGHILVVDDEAMVRQAIRGLLERLGYRVTEADDGAAALDIFEATPEAFDLVLMDLRMPGMSGPDCLQRMRRRTPALNAILSSGHLTPETVRQTHESDRTGFLRKPYTIGRLADAVQAAIGAGDKLSDRPGT